MSARNTRRSKPIELTLTTEEHDLLDLLTLEDISASAVVGAAIRVISTLSSEARQHHYMTAVVARARRSNRHR